MSNYTQLGFIKQTDGENEGTWGDKLNENLIDLLDDAIGGYVEVSVASGNVTLAFADGTADNNGRHAVIKFTGSPGTTRTVTFPDVQINYFIINGSDSSVICTSGTGAATVTIPTGMKDIIYIDGSDEVLSMFSTPRLSSSSDLTIDSGADIILDADGADVVIKDGGTAIGKFTNSSSDFVITTSVQDKDFIVKGDDGGSAITALTLDMSAAGAATFNDKVVATELDISGNMDIDGTSNLDAVDIDGATQIDATVTVGVDDTGYDVKFFGATSGSYILWDESADSLLLTDSTPIKIGDSQDLTLYHDGTNSYITNAVGALKIATETSGIAVTIGHTTSETTIADNATITGNLSVGGNFDVTGTLDFSDSAITNAGDIQLDSITGDGDTDTAITFSGSNVITFKANNENQITINDGSILPSTDDNIDLGSSSYEFKDAYFDGTVTTDGLTVSSTTNLDGAIQVDNTITVGVDDTGYDVKFFGATASAYMLWDASADDLVLAGAAGIDLAGDIDVDGTANLDAVDIDGAVQVDNTITVGADDQGYDVKFFGDTASAYMLWDTSADDLILGGAAGLVVPDGQLTLGSTAVASTAAELNIMDGGTAASSITLADADRLVTNDDGTMKQVALTTLKTYLTSAGFSSEDPTALAIALG